MWLNFLIFLDNKNQWIRIGSIIACVSILAIVCIVIYSNTRCRNRLKDNLPCTKSSTRETDSKEMAGLQALSNDFAGVTSKIDQTFLCEKSDKDED